MGVDLTGYSLAAPITTPNMFGLVGADKGITHLKGDICDLPTLERAISDAKPELIIHMAAQALVRASYDAPVANYATNVMGTVHLLDAVRRCPSVRAVLVWTSDKGYENREMLWGYREPDPMGGYDPYSSSKGCAELVASAYRRSYFHPHKYAEHGVAIASARAGNVIGGGDWAQDRLVPDAMRAWIGKTTLEIRNPNATRPWQHVLDPLHGYLQLSQQLLGKDAVHFADGCNFGPHSDRERSVEHMLTVLAGKWGAPPPIWRQAVSTENPHEANYLRLDCTKARSLLKWRPNYTLEQALTMTAEWYKIYQANGDLHALTLQQIDDIVHRSGI
jgi:CDP-glucose 4,6-dehydratase